MAFLILLNQRNQDTTLMAYWMKGLNSVMRIQKN